eukprot:ctg_273.g154
MWSTHWRTKLQTLDMGKIFKRTVSLEACAPTETDKVLFRQRLREVRRELAKSYIGKRFDGVKAKPEKKVTQVDLYYRAPVTKKLFLAKPFYPDYSLLDKSHFERERGLHYNDHNLKREKKRKEIAEKLAQQSATWVTKENLDRKVETVVSNLLEN